MVVIAMEYQYELVCIVSNVVIPMTLDDLYIHPHLFLSPLSPFLPFLPLPFLPLEVGPL